MGFLSKVSGSGFIILNVVRALNIISLLTCIAASVCMLIKTFIITTFFVFDSLTHVVTILMSAFLIVSELPWFKRYFEKNWPLLGVQSGFVTLGIFMIIDGSLVLGNLNSDQGNSKDMGSSFLQIIEAGGILAYTMGVFNIGFSYIFRDRKGGVTARMVRNSGATAAQKVENEMAYAASSPTARSSPSVRTVVSTNSDRLPLHNHAARPASSRYSQSTMAVGDNYTTTIPKDELANMPAPPSISGHPAFNRASVNTAEWV